MAWSWMVVTSLAVEGASWRAANLSALSSGTAHCLQATVLAVMLAWRCSLLALLLFQVGP